MTAYGETYAKGFVSGEMNRHHPGLGNEPVSRSQPELTEPDIGPSLVIGGSKRARHICCPGVKKGGTENGTG